MARRTIKTLVVDRYVNLDLYYRNQQAQPSGCIEWHGSLNNAGFGLIGFTFVDGKVSSLGRSSGMMTPHRLAFMIDRNRLPQQRNINHTCHNKLCVNPAHLSEGTQREKLDAMLKDGIKGGREVGVPIGSYNHKQLDRKYKYSEEDIQWIRTAPLDDITQRFNVDRARASAMRHSFRIGYAWLPCPPYNKDRTGRKPRKEIK